MMSIFKSFVGFAVGIVFGVVVSFELDLWQSYQVRQNVISAFVGDIETLMEQEEKDRPSWYRKIDLLDNVDALRNPGGRPWLMREAFDSARLVVFEANAEKLGLLPKPLPKEIARFYALTARLKAEVQHLANPVTIKANQDENRAAVDEHKRTREKWVAAAGLMLESLHDAAKRGWRPWP